MEEATDHPVLKVMPEMTEVQKKFGTMSLALINYEEEIKNIWMNHNVNIVSYHQGRFKVLWGPGLNIFRWPYNAKL